VILLAKMKKMEKRNGRKVMNPKKNPPKPIVKKAT
jgi:hypothetical protein